MVFNKAWEQLNQWYAPRKADLIYLRVLGLAARTLESDVAGALGLLLTTEARWNERDVERLLELEPAPAPEITRGEVTLDVYDQLLRAVSYEPA